MPEHIHLLITEPEIGNPSTVMQVLKQRTARALLPKRHRKDPRQRSLFGEEPRPRVLAGALLRLQRLDHQKAGRKVTVHASQSSEAGHWSSPQNNGDGAAIVSTHSTKPDR
jgi:hypothetical protein